MIVPVLRLLGVGIVLGLGPLAAVAGWSAAVADGRLPAETAAGYTGFWRTVALVGAVVAGIGLLLEVRLPGPVWRLFGWVPAPGELRDYAGPPRGSGTAVLAFTDRGRTPRQVTVRVQRQSHLSEPGRGTGRGPETIRGFGRSDKHGPDQVRALPRDVLRDPAADVVARQDRAVQPELLDQPDDCCTGGPATAPKIGHHDLGPRQQRDDRAELTWPTRRPMVLTPSLPGIGERISTAAAQQEFWYQSFNQLSLADTLIDGRTDAVRAFLRHFCSHWSGPGFTLAEDHLEHLVSSYAEPCAFTASLVNSCGVGVAMEMLLTGEPIDAQRALATNLVSKVVPHDELMAATEDLVSKILRNDQFAIESAKETILDVIGRPLDDQLAIEALWGYSTMANPAIKQRLKEFYDKTDIGRAG
jgi:hypothetical protein